MVSLMKAVNYTTPGLIENLSIEMRQIPMLKNNECLIKVYYSAINRADTLQRKGLYPPPPNESDILGLEAVGIISESLSSKWQKNDRVMALLGGGGNAEYVAVNENHLIKIPDQMSFKSAASIPEVFLTAFQLLYWISDITKNGKLNEAKVLVHSGASGVGTSLIQILKNVLKVKTVFATVGSEEKKKKLEKEFNVTKCFNYKNPEEENFGELILKLTNNSGVDLVLDCVGANYWQKNLECLSLDGEWVLYGLMSGGSVNGDLLAKIMRKRIHLKTSTLRNRSSDYKNRLIIDFEKILLGEFITGNLKPIIDQVFNLNDIGLAHQRMESNLNFGKILLKVNNDEENINNEL